jgi:hypothetical protein
MRRRLLLGTLLAAVAAVLAISGTAVAGKAINGCPDSYSLIKAKVDPVVDINGDGWICTKQIGPSPGGIGFSDIDNVANR